MADLPPNLVDLVMWCLTSISVGPLWPRLRRTQHAMQRAVPIVATERWFLSGQAPSAAAALTARRASARAHAPRGPAQHGRMLERRGGSGVQRNRADNLLGEVLLCESLPQSAGPNSGRSTASSLAANGVSCRRDLRQAAWRDSANGDVPIRRVGGHPHESVERVPLAEAILACERACCGRAPHAAFKHVFGDQLMHGFALLDTGGTLISPIASSAHVPAGAGTLASPGRKHCG